MATELSCTGPLRGESVHQPGFLRPSGRRRFQVHPVLGVVPKKRARRRAESGADATTLTHDVIHAGSRDVQANGQTTGRQTVLLHELGAQNRSWMDGDCCSLRNFYLRVFHRYWRESYVV